MRSSASPFLIRTPLLKSKPVSSVASIAAAGAAAFASTSRVSKSVWVSSSDSGPRSGEVGLSVWERETSRDGRLTELLLRKVDGMENDALTEAQRKPFDDGMA